jgi:hypothetical protein
MDDEYLKDPEANVELHELVKTLRSYEQEGHDYMSTPRNQENGWNKNIKVDTWKEFWHGKEDLSEDADLGDRGWKENDWDLNLIADYHFNVTYDAPNCSSCDGDGYSSKAKWFSDQWYGNMPFEPEEYGVPELKIDDYYKEIIGRKIKNSIERSKEQGEPNYYMSLPGVKSFEDAVNVEAKRMWNIESEQWHHHLNQDDVDALVREGRLRDFTHTFTKGEGWEPKDPPYHPTAEEVNKWSREGLGHDSINAWVCIENRCKREGVDAKCPECKGKGYFRNSSDRLELYIWLLHPRKGASRGITIKSVDPSELPEVKEMLRYSFEKHKSHFNWALEG